MNYFLPGLSFEPRMWLRFVVLNGIVWALFFLSINWISWPSFFWTLIHTFLFGSIAALRHEEATSKRSKLYLGSIALIALIALLSVVATFILMRTGVLPWEDSWLAFAFMYIISAANLVSCAIHTFYWHRQRKKLIFEG